MALGLLAFFLQATLPFFLTTCPVYATAWQLAKTQPVSSSFASVAPKAMADAALAADCPMQAQQPLGKTAPGQKQVPCPLCDIMSPFHGYVTAGLIGLPPPIAEQQVEFSPVLVSVAPAIRAASFSARAPPARI